jgi:hypothetical protein
MSYTPTEWKTGDIVSSQRLNKLEEGVKDAYEVMVINNTGGVLDKTWQEIHDAMDQGKMCIVRTDTSVPFSSIGTAFVESVINNEGECSVKAGMYTYTASSATGYPTTSSN